MNNEDTRESVSKEAGDGSARPLLKGRRAFQNITRELSDDDLTNPAVGKLLLNEIDRLESENAEFGDYQEQFHEADKKVAVLQEKSKIHLATEILSGVCFTIGAAMIGYAPVLWKSQPSGWMVLVFGSVLIFGGIFAKVVRR